MSDSSADRDPLDRLAEEFVARFRAGERPSLTEYATRLPGREEEVRDLFPALVEMEQLKPVTADQTVGYVPRAEPSDPVRLGDFRILRRVGSGGMGVVYEAVQESLVRHVALKLLPAEALLDPKKLERFRREAKSAARLHHTNIVPVFGTGEADGRHFYAMQFIAGHPLDAVIDEVKRLKEKSDEIVPATSERGVSAIAAALVTGTFAASPVSPSSITVTYSPTPPDQQPRTSPPGSASETNAVASSSFSTGGSSYWATVARIGAQVSDALDYAHKQGVQHRDIKPANLLLDPRGTVWITDFGLAKTSDADDGLTQMGDVVGTLRYMAPERFDGSGDHRADIYALGLTLYELLTLTPAFTASNRAKLVELAIAANPPRPRSINPSIPKDVETIVLKAIARDPAMRYQTAGELHDDLQRYLEDRPITARRASSAEMAFRWCRRNPAVASLMTAVLLVFAVGAGVSWFFAHEAERKEKNAREEAQRADDERNRANEESAKVHAEQDRTHHLLYLARMADSGIAYQDNRIDRVLEILQETKPAVGEPDRRDWEWHFLRRATTSTARIVALPRVELPPVPAGQIPLEPYSLVRVSADGRTALLNRNGPSPALEQWDLIQGKRTRSWPGLWGGSGNLSPDGRYSLRSIDVMDQERWFIDDLETGRELPGPNVELPEIKLGNSGQLMNYRWDHLGPGGAYAVANSRDETHDGQYYQRPLFVWYRASGKFHRLDARVESNDVKKTGHYNGGWGDVPFLSSDGKTLLQTSSWIKVGAGAAGASLVYECQIDRWDVSTEPPRHLGTVRVPGMQSINYASTNDDAGSAMSFSRNGEWYAFYKGRQAAVYRVADGQLAWSALLPDSLVNRGYLQAPPAPPAVSDSGNRLIIREVQHSILVIERPHSTTDPVGRSHRFHADWGESDAREGIISADGETLVLHPKGKEALAIWDLSRPPTVAAANRAPPRYRPLEPATTRFTADGRRALDAPGRQFRGGVPYPESLTLRDGPTWRQLARLDPPPGFGIEGAQFAAAGERVVVRSVRPEQPNGFDQPVHWALYDTSDGRLIQTRELQEGPRWQWGIAGIGPWLVERKTEFAVEEKPGGGWQRVMEPDPDSAVLPPGGQRQLRPKKLSETLIVSDVLTGKELRKPAQADWPTYFTMRDFDTSDRRPVLIRTLTHRQTHLPTEGNVFQSQFGVTAFDRSTAQQLWSIEDFDRYRFVSSGAPAQERVSRSFANEAVDSTTDGKRLVSIWTPLTAISKMREPRLWMGSTEGGTGHVITLPSCAATMNGYPRACIAPAGQLIAASDGPTVYLVDPDTGEIRHRLAGNPAQVLEMTFSADASRLFVYTFQWPIGTSRLTVWDTKAGRRLLEIPLAFEQPNAMNNARAKVDPLGQLFYRDGKVFVTTGDGVRVFDGTPMPETKK